MRTKQEYLIRYKDGNLYCELADIWIDPGKPVKKALITHAHFDHFTFGCEEYISTNETAILLKERVEGNIKIKTFDYGEEFKINGINNQEKILPTNRVSFNRISSFMIVWSNKFVVIALLTISAIALSKQAWA